MQLEESWRLTERRNARTTFLVIFLQSARSFSFVQFLLQEFDWAGWLDWRESYLATGVVRIWTEGTAAFLSKVQPFELRPGEVTSSVLFYLAVVLLLWGLTAQPKQ
jgi:hypothetical protein